MLENIISRNWLKGIGLPLLLRAGMGVVAFGDGSCSQNYGLDGNRYCADKDNDGFGDIHCFDKDAPAELYTFVAPGAEPPKGYVFDHTDCNDVNDKINPKAIELCNKIDDNCNGQTDEYAVPIKWYEDNDEDGYGSEKYVLDCPAPKKHVDNNDDCEDSKPLVHPGAKDICNLVDDDCNGVTDDLSDVCKTSCGEGKLYCEGKKTVCDAPKPQKEICDGKDNDCNGKVDELAQCCVPDTVEKKYCGDGKTVEKQRTCKSDYTWGDLVTVGACWTPSYKWTCEKKVIGIVDVNAPHYNFTPKQPTNADVGSSTNQNGLPQWCCTDSSAKEWGVESNPMPKYYLQIGCSCISYVKGIDDNTKNNHPNDKKGSKEMERKDVFWNEGFQCPSHEYSSVETTIEILFQNEGLRAENVWLNYYTYGHGPSERVMLNAGEEHRFLIDERMIPASGTEIELCTSVNGCSEKVRVESGDKKKLYAVLYGTKIRAMDGEGREYRFDAKEVFEKCETETNVKVIVRNHKTLDLQPWMNWQQGWPVQEKVVVEPGAEYTFHVTKDSLVQGVNEIALCTSSYGCFPTQFISCGDHKTYTIDWVFGRIAPEKK